MASEAILRYAHSVMNGMEWLAFIAVAVAWFVINAIVLPRLGVPT